MLYTPENNFAFLHCMKAGGSTIRNWFRENFKDKQFIVQGAYHEPLRNKVAVKGHEWLEETQILAITRNPYSLLVSFYFFWKEYPAKRNHQTMAAHNLTFSEFIDWYISELSTSKGNGPYLPEDYLLIDGKLHDNLHLLKLEEIDGFPAVIKKIGLDVPTQLVQTNASHHEHPAVYFNAQTEGKVQQLFSWTFNNGLYSPHVKDIQYASPEESESLYVREK